MRTLRFCLPMLALAGLAPGARALDLDEILRRNLEARGGAEKIAALKSVRFTGERKFRGGFKLDYALLIARPGRVRAESSTQGLTQVEAWDGAEGWQISPFGGRKDPERLGADDAKELADLAELDGPLIGAKASGSRVEFLGSEELDGTDALKLKVTRKNGDYLYVFLDPDQFLEIRITSHRTVRGAEEVSEVDLGEYAMVAGVWFPMAIDAGAPGGKRFAFTKFTKTESDPAVTGVEFRFPAEAAKQP